MKDGCYSHTGKKDESTSNVGGSRESDGSWWGRLCMGTGEDWQGWQGQQGWWGQQGWHLYLVRAEDRVDAAQHLFCVFSLGVPTDNDLSRVSVGGRTERVESCYCTHTATRPVPRGWSRRGHTNPSLYLFEGVMEDSGRSSHLRQGYRDLLQPL